MTFAIFVAGAFVAACITGFAGFAFSLVGADRGHVVGMEVLRSGSDEAIVRKVVPGLLLASGVALLTAWK